MPSSIASDCSADATSSLSKWISSVPDNSSLMLGKGACYRVDGSITISNRRSLLFDGNGSTLQAKTRGERARIHLGIDNSENIIVRNLTVKGANPDAGASREAYQAELEAQHAFNLGSVRHVLLDGVSASDVYGDFVYISSSDTCDVCDVHRGNRASMSRSSDHASAAADAKASPSRRHKT